MAGKVNLELQLVELIPLIELAMDVVRPGAQAKGIELASALENRPGVDAASPGAGRGSIFTVPFP
jgi:hypothetical protein